MTQTTIAELVATGDVLSSEGRSREAMGSYERAILQLGEAAVTEPARDAALAFRGLVREQLRLGRLEDAASNAARGVRELCDIDSPGVRQILAATVTDGLTACDKLVERVTASTPRACAEVAQVLWIKSVLLCWRDERQKQLATLDTLLERVGASTAPEVDEPVARALLSKGFALSHLNRPTEALDAWDQLLGRFGSHPPTGAPFVTLDAMCAKAIELRDLGRSADALNVCNELVARYGSYGEVRAQVKVATGLGVKRQLLEAHGASDDAVMAVDEELLSRFWDATEPSLREAVAYALAAKIWWLKKSRRTGEAICLSDQLLEIVDDGSRSPAPTAAGELVMTTAQTLLAGKHKELEVERREQAVRLLGWIERRFHDAADPTQARLRAKATIERAEILSLLGRIKQSAAAFEEAMSLGEPAASVFEEMAGKETRSGGMRSAIRAGVGLAGAKLSRWK